MNRKKVFVSRYSGLNINPKDRQPGPIRTRLIKAVPYVTWGTIVAIYLFCLYKFALTWIAENGMPHTVLGAIATFGLIFFLPTAFIFMFLAGEKLIGFHPIEDLLYWMLGHKQPAARNPNTSGTDSDAAHRAFMQGVAIGRASGRRSGL
ncbi:hypothetical protein [Acidithiobacillus thiooxidans]|uniref:hypothetical protein n=1 Tax=Acidithiobacillus thiooxidans TaxID=930 RepID=UPI0035638DA0